jgi:hypothetical protein
MAHYKPPPVRQDDPGGAGGRSRDLTGRLRQKGDDALAGTIEERYGVDFHGRSDMRLETLRNGVGLTGIKALVEAARGVGVMQSARRRRDGVQRAERGIFLYES